MGRSKQLPDERDVIKRARVALREGRRGDGGAREARRVKSLVAEVERYGGTGWSGRRRLRSLLRETERLEGARPGAVREGVDTVVWVASFTILIRIFLVQAFQIPSGSMESTLLVGDYLLVNKFLYGPKTPDRIPLTDIRLPSVRFPGVRDVRAGDIVVFQYPHDTKQDYIKRCVAASGDTLEIRESRVYVNGVLREEAFTQHLHRDLVQVSSELEAELGRRPSAAEIARNAGKPHREVREILMSGDPVRELRRRWDGPYNSRAWNRDDFGPVVVPEGQLFMMGDNRDFSSDSRYWGFLDEDLVRGKAMFIYWSRNRDEMILDPWNGYRWSRIGRLIH